MTVIAVNPTLTAILSLNFEVPKTAQCTFNAGTLMRALPCGRFHAVACIGTGIGPTRAVAVAVAPIGQQQRRRGDFSGHQ